MKKILCLLFCLGLGMPMSVLAQEDKPPPVEVKEEPVLSVWCNQREVLDHLDLYDESVLEVYVEEDVQSVSVWIDENPYLFEIVDGTFEIPVGLDNQKIQIEVINVLEETFTKEIRVHALSNLEAQLQLEKTYTLKDTHQIEFGSVCLDKVQAKIYVNDELTQTIDCQGKKQVSFTLSRSGKIQVKLEYLDCKEPVLINGSESLMFFFSCEQPKIQILSQTTISNQDIPIQFIGPDFIERVEVRVDDGQSVHTYTTLEDLTLLKREGEAVTYRITVNGNDLFDRFFSHDQLVTIDAKKPYLTVLHGDQILHPGTLNLFSQRSSLNMVWDEPTSTKIFAWVQGKQIEIENLNSLWTSWPDLSVFSVLIQGQDPVGNVSNYTFDLQVIPPVLPTTPQTPIQDTMEELKSEKQSDEKEEKEIETVNTSWIPGNIQDIQKVHRTWKINDSQQVILEKQEKEIEDHTRPLIQVRAGKDCDLAKLQLHDRVLITLVNTQSYSQDRFVEIVINGKKADLDLLKKDVLGNEFLEVVIEDPTTTIEAKAIDNSDNITTFYKTLKVMEERPFSWLPIIGIGTIVLIGAVVVIILRKHDKNQDFEG